jgi:hypothetical protein
MKDEKIIKELIEIKTQIVQVRKDIKESIIPKFIPIQTKNLIEHAIELWRFESRINRILIKSSEEEKKLITNSINKLKRYLVKNDIELIDYTNQKYNDGLNLEILAVEKDPKIVDSIIKETKEPTVTHKGKVISKGKVIILIKEDSVEEKNE